MKEEDVEVGKLYWTNRDEKREVIRVESPFVAIEAQDLGCFNVRFLCRHPWENQSAALSANELNPIPWLVQLAMQADERYDIGFMDEQNGS